VSALLTVLAFVGAWSLGSVLILAGLLLAAWGLPRHRQAPCRPRAPRYLDVASPHPQHHVVLWIDAPDDVTAWVTLERSA
jgi:hypothetical protein